MITLNTERGLERIESWSDVESLPGFKRDIDPKTVKLSSIIGKYRLADRGVEMEHIQQLLGHADVRQTYDYVEPNLLAIRRAMSQVFAGI